MIGIFDSGSGGLTVLSALKRKAPMVDVIYFGDIKNAPYGNKSKQELEALLVSDIQILVDRGVKNIVSACNSLSSAFKSESLKIIGAEPLGLVEMVEPTVEFFKGKDKKILLVATKATIGSNIYQNSFQNIGITIETKAIPELASSIERGATDEENYKIISNALSTIDLNKFDTLILGCTHYPLVRNLFEKICPPNIDIFDPAEPVSDKVIEHFGSEGSGMIRFVISKDSEAFRKRVRDMGFESSTVEVV